MPSAATLRGLAIDDTNCFEKLIHWLGDDFRQADPNELDEKLRSQTDMLLPDEQVQMGFICGRDTIIFTTHRAVKIDKQGFTGKKVLYLSIPWTKVQRYEVESAHSWDLDAKLMLMIEAPWFKKNYERGLSIDFATGRSDILAINQYISAQVVGGADGTSAVPREVLPAHPQNAIEEFFSWLGDDNHAIPREDAEAKFKLSPKILLDDESVEMAFKCGRDFHLSTTKRWIKVDVVGMFSKRKVKYESVPLASLACYSVKTPASNIFDQDAEIEMRSNIGDWGFDVKKGQGDIMAVYTLMNQKCVLAHAKL